MNSRSLAGVSQMCLRGREGEREEVWSGVVKQWCVVREWCSETVVCSEGVV